MSVTKPLLVIPPAVARWPAVRELSVHDTPLWWDDLQKRLGDGVPGAQDVFAIAPDGGLVLGLVALSKRHDLGVLTRLFVREEHRRRGLARALLETVVSWFDMAGGKWLYTTATAEAAEPLLGKLGFATIRRAKRTPYDAVVMLRAAEGVPHDPLLTANGAFSVHDVSRANWPSLVTLLYNRAGADPRVSVDESAVTAEVTALELISQQEAGTCQLKAAFHGTRLVGLASVAVDTPGDRTYGMVMPHGESPEQLRDAIVAFAKSKGYKHVDFPLEALAPEARKPAPREAAIAAPVEAASVSPGDLDPPNRATESAV